MAQSALSKSMVKHFLPWGDIDVKYQMVEGTPCKTYSSVGEATNFVVATCFVLIGSIQEHECPTIFFPPEVTIPGSIIANWGEPE